MLNDGRFAFFLKREDEDLRSFIDHWMKLRINKEGEPFGENGGEYMFCIAQEMDYLYSCNIIHMDLKTSKLMCSILLKKFEIINLVVDFECSIGILKTMFWRALKILQTCKDKIVNSRHELFT